MNCFGNASGFLSCRASGVPLAVRFGRSWCNLLRYQHHYSSHSHDVACCHGELELLIDALQPPINGLADAAYGLTPAEVLFNALSDALAQPVAGVPGGACVNRAAAAPCSVPRHMRDHVTRTAVGDK